MKRRRIFISINLPDEIKKELSKFKRQDIPVKWVKENNLHITLLFLGDIVDEDLPEIITHTKEITDKTEPFLVTLNKIDFSPQEKNNAPPKMIWVTGEKPEELLTLQKNLYNNLSFSKEKNTFNLHITLGRIRQMEFRKIDPEEIPVIEKEISLSWQINEIHIMESRSKKGGSEYMILESVPLSR